MEHVNKIIFSVDAKSLFNLVVLMLPEVSGEGESWQRKAINLWSATVDALYYIRDIGVDAKFITPEMKGEIAPGCIELSIETVYDFLMLKKIEFLYVIGFQQALRQNGQWPDGLVGVKNYLESGLPQYKTDKLIAKHGVIPLEGFDSFDQSAVVFEQHVYRSSQMAPVLNLLKMTYARVIDDQSQFFIPEGSGSVVTMISKSGGKSFFFDAKNEKGGYQEVDPENGLLWVQGVNKISSIQARNIGKMGSGLIRILRPDYLEMSRPISVAIELRPKMAVAAEEEVADCV